MLNTKSKRLLLILAVLAVLALGGFVAVNILAYRHAWAMMHFTEASERTRPPEKLTVREKIGVLLHGVSLPRPQTLIPPGTLGAGARSLTVDSAHGIKLGAWYCPRPRQNPVVILFHSYGAEKSGALPEARAFLEMGCSVLLIDFRGSGESSESYTTIGYDEGEDVAAAVRFARERLAHPTVILYGESMGAAAVLRAVHDFDIKPDAIILEAVFDNLLNTVRHRFELMGVPTFPGAELLVFWGGWQAGFDGFAHNPVRYAADVRCPILFLQGAADPRARPEEARRVFAAVPGSRTFKEFPGLSHEAAVVRAPEDWKTTVRQFLSGVFPSIHETPAPSRFSRLLAPSQ